MAATHTKRDRHISYQTHKLFWEANFYDPWTLIGWALTRPTALLVYNVLIPVQVAYGLQAIVTRHFESVMHYAIWVVVLAAAYCVLWGIGGVLICRNGRVGDQYLQKKIFGNFIKKDYEFYSNNYIGALGAQAMRLKDAFNEYCQLIMNGVTKQVIVVIASVLIIGYHSLLLAGITLLSMLLILSFTLASSKWRLKYRRTLSEANSTIAGSIGDALSHGATVKSFATEDHEEQTLAKELKTWAHIQYMSWMTSIPSDLGRMLLAAFATAALLIVAARLYQQHTITIAIVALMQLYVIKLITATQDIADLIKSYDAVMSAAYHSVKTMLVQPKVVDVEHPKRLPKNNHLSIVFDHVTYRYDEARDQATAVVDFDLHIQPGEKVGLVGYSGSGKTTLTKLLLRFMDVTGGDISLGGIDVRQLAQRELRKRIAYVPQEPLLFHRSVIDNIAYGKPGSSRKAAERAAHTAYVDEFVHELPKEYDTLVGERGVKLSGGQRQRVAIARALLKDAPILVLDEATSALDSRSEKLIQEALWRLMKGRTALVIAHRLSTIQRMDRIVVMDKGRVVQVGTHDELLKDKRGIYAELWAHQSGGYIAGKTKSDEPDIIDEK